MKACHTFFFFRTAVLALGAACLSVSAKEASAEWLNERLACIEVDRDCSFSELIKLEKPIAITGDTVILATIRSNRPGHIGMFWYVEGAPHKSTAKNGMGFDVAGGGEWRTYPLRPGIPIKGRVEFLRMYFHHAKDPSTRVTLKSIAFERRGFKPFDAKDADGIVFRMKSDAFKWLSLNWNARKGDKDPVPFYMGFSSIPDGREHVYWFDLKNTKERITFGKPHWFGTIEGFTFRENMRFAEFMPEGVEFVKGVPRIPADPVVRQVFPEDAIPRAGRPLPIEVVVRNYGTEAVEGIRFSLEGLPDGMRVMDAADLSPTGTIAPSAGYDYVRDDYMTNGLPNERRFRITLSDPGRAMSFSSRLLLKAANGAHSEKEFSVKVLPSLGLAPCPYPPEPKPLDMGGVEVGVFLFPGWRRHQWYPLWDCMPERKPVLGWYDDSSPEVRDWQIKWLVENGISYAFVDWYWSPKRGPSPYNYWTDGFAKARYRRYLKYALLWCNERDYRHSEKDQEMVTKYWIDNFFADPQYMRIDGKPVVGMWALNMENALGPGGAEKLIAISQKMAREAGYPGIYFVSIHGAGDASVARRRHLKEVGLDASFEYYYNAIGMSGSPGFVDGMKDYSVVVDSSYARWKSLRDACDLPFFPSLSTGTDRRPWCGDRSWAIVNKTPAKFAKICREAKRFSEETGVKRLLTGPLDEWCEGEIGYPNAEHGFGMLEAVREAFAKKPPEGFPLNYAPQDVGLGPYTKAEALIPRP